MEYLGWLLVGLLMGGGIVFFAIRFLKKPASESSDSKSVVSLLTSHFQPVFIENVTISERKFPFRVRADLQRAINRLFSDETKLSLKLFDEPKASVLPLSRN